MDPKRGPHLIIEQLKYLINNINDELKINIKIFGLNKDIKILYQELDEAKLEYEYLTTPGYLSFLSSNYLSENFVNYKKEDIKNYNSEELKLNAFFLQFVINNEKFEFKSELPNHFKEFLNKNEIEPLLNKDLNNFLYL